jgi:hypothetical protein
MGLSADTNNRLLVADVPKISVLFGIGLLSGPTPILCFFGTDTIWVLYPLAPEDEYSYSQAIIEFSYVLYVPIVRDF